MRKLECSNDSGSRLVVGAGKNLDGSDVLAKSLRMARRRSLQCLHAVRISTGILEDFHGQLRFFRSEPPLAQGFAHLFQEQGDFGVRHHTAFPVTSERWATRQRAETKPG